LLFFTFFSSGATETIVMLDLGFSSSFSVGGGDSDSLVAGCWLFLPLWLWRDSLVVGHDFFSLAAAEVLLWLLYVSFFVSGATAR
jgi:hypothetical protein